MSKMTGAFAAAVLLALLCGVGEAKAQEGAWCAYGGGRNDYENCGYYTLRQCLAAISGVGGACRPNPRGGYGPPYSDDEPPPPRRRHRY
jgi:hypothetical protein